MQRKLNKEDSGGGFFMTLPQIYFSKLTVYNRNLTVDWPYTVEERSNVIDNFRYLITVQNIQTKVKRFIITNKLWLN